MEAIVREYVEEQSLSRLVDYGCGNMPYRPLFEPHVEEYVGCDLAENESADCVLEPSGRLAFETGSIDVVLSSQVLEHVPDPVLYLSECHRALRRNGLLVLSTHGVWKYHPDPTDYWRWTSAGLRRIVEDCGFEIGEFRGVMAPASYALQLWQDAVAGSIPRFFRSPFFAVMQLLIQAADRLSSAKARQRDACVFLLVAKPEETSA